MPGVVVEVGRVVVLGEGGGDYSKQKYMRDM